MTIDISPATFGNNDLGTNDGNGYSVNPVTGDPYAPDEVLQGDFARALAEFWADGPAPRRRPDTGTRSPTPSATHPASCHRIGLDGPEVDRLEWDVKTYFALNGALHDAAIAAWGDKGYFD